MRKVLALFVVLLACASLPTLSEAGKPGGGGGGRGAVQLVPEAVVPGPGEPGASASATVTVRRTEVRFAMTVNQLSGFITTIAIYKGGVGETGPMVVRLSPSAIGINQLLGTVPADGTVCGDISRNPGDYFIQVNTNLYPGGSMRAQLK